ncbi:MAG: hypothetical protein KatS3mg027_0051 [Bacteroidia bacterium]|nr:MAG: hypothetical protein KatS3mg027_0051 [Bacteroidia bacterium]
MKVLLINKNALLVLVVLFIFSCKKENAFDCAKPTGKIITESRNTSYFHTIVTQGKIDLYLKQGNFSIQVKAGKNIIKNIETKIENETLYLANNNKCNFIRDPQKKIEIYIQLPELKYLKHNGSGNIYSESTFIQDTLILRIESPGDVHLNVQTHYFGGSTHGNGDLYITGITDYFYYNYNGTNYIYANDLKVQNYVYLESHSVGHAYVNLDNIGMDAALFSNGNIYYSGNPTYLSYKSKGKGRVIKN